MGKKIVKRKGAKVLEWDMEQLRYIAEIARRLPSEGPAKVAKDFWKRGVKDRRGRLWGKQVPKPASPIQQVNRCCGVYSEEETERRPLPAVLPGGAMVPPHEAQG